MFLFFRGGVEVNSFGLKLHLHCCAIEGMLNSGTAYDVFDPYAGHQALRRAANLRGQNDRHELFADPAL